MSISGWLLGVLVCDDGAFAAVSVPPLQKVLFAVPARSFNAFLLNVPSVYLSEEHALDILQGYCEM